MRVLNSQALDPNAPRPKPVLMRARVILLLPGGGDVAENILQPEQINQSANVAGADAAAGEVAERSFLEKTSDNMFRAGQTPAEVALRQVMLKQRILQK